jgi:hypothetical protein
LLPEDCPQFFPVPAADVLTGMRWNSRGGVRAPVSTADLPLVGAAAACIAT